MRTIGIILVIALWLLLGWKMCTDYSNCCADDAVTSLQQDAAPGVLTPAASTSACSDGFICFAAGSATAIFGDNFNAYRDSLIALVGDGEQLKITGLYTSSENTDGQTNLGMQRADAIRKIFSSLKSEQISTSDQIVVGRELSASERIRLDIIDANADGSADSSNDSADSRSDVSVASTSKVSSNAVIYFPFNSTNKLNDSAIEKYLDEIADRIRVSGERVRLTGHTDDIGGTASNITLGQRRANIIADYLIGKGVRHTQIRAESMGESQPVESNATEVGRAKNRRTELQIIQ